MPEPVLVSAPEYRKGEAVFTAAEDCAPACAPEDEAGLAAAVRDAGVRAVIVGVVRYTGPLYEALGAGGGGLIARFGVGHDSVDKAQAAAHGIVVTNTPGVLDASVAEHAIALMGALARHIGRGHAAMMDGRWEPRTGMELEGKTLGLIGFGAIARRVARIAAHGFGMRVIACGRREGHELAGDEGRPLPAILHDCGTERYTTCAEEVLAEADLVSLHLPGSETDFLNAERLAVVRPGALLINTARGSVVDEPALYDALATGRLGGAAIDVYAQEPYQPADPNKDLRTLDNVLLTPHTGSNTADCNARMAAAALRNVEAYLAGRDDELNRVN